VRIAPRPSLHLVLYLVFASLSSSRLVSSRISLFVSSLLSELAKVFFEKILYGAWETGSGISIVIGAAAWMTATMVVLMSMDVLECFLHALRLHWVEFQNKFFYADGVAFAPFSYRAAMDADKDK
jgi:V-type H+-transporting ATPase subunit a